MRKLLFALFLVGCQAAKAESIQKECPAPPPPSACEVGPQLDVHFSPNGHTTEYLVSSLAKAKSHIFVQAYSFTSAPIGEALVAAKKRGVKVQVIIDKSQQNGKGAVAPMLINNGIAVYLDEKHTIAHNKVIIVDTDTVYTGSFNFTNAAEKSNAENLITIVDARIRNIYLENWMLHEKHATLLNR